MYVCIYLSIYLSISRSIDRSIDRSIYLYTYICMYAVASYPQPIYLSITSYPSLSITSYPTLSIYLSHHTPRASRVTWKRLGHPTSIYPTSIYMYAVTSSYPQNVTSDMEATGASDACGGASSLLIRTKPALCALLHSHTRRVLARLALLASLRAGGGDSW